MGLADMRGVDNDPGWINRKFRELERMIEGLRSERRIASATIGDGGSLVVDGGEFVALDVDGSFLLRVGPQDLGDRGTSIFREDGSPAFEVAKPNPLAVQAWRLKDNAGTVIVGESGFGQGLGRPRLPCAPFPVLAPAYGTYGAEVSTTSASFATLFALQDRRQNPLWSPAFRVKCSDTTTSAELRVVDVATGTPLTEFGFGAWTGIRPTGSTTYTEFTPSLVVPTTIAVDGRYRFEIQARRTAGVGTVTLAIPESTGG